MTGVTTLDLKTRKSFWDGRQLAWDSTSLKALKKCARYYYLSIVEGWQPRAMRVHLDFGSWFHKAMEIFDHARVREGGLQESDLIAAVREMLVLSAKRTEDGTFVSYWDSPHEAKNIESLVRSVVWYFDHYRNDAFHVIRLNTGAAAVELSFNFSLPFAVEGTELTYCGHLDALGSYGGETYFLDRKTTGSSLSESFFKQFSPDVQMTGYTLAAQVAFSAPSSGGIIDALQVGAGFTRFGRQIVLASHEQLDEWLEGAQQYIDSSFRYHDLGRWPMNETACTMYAGCEFLGVCSKSPSLRERFLEATFERRIWDPLVPR